MKDRSDKEEIRIEYYPAEEMLLDFNTKPSQGSLFHKFRKVIMRWKPISFLKEENTKIEQNYIEKKMVLQLRRILEMV